MGRPEDLMGAVTFLSSDASLYVTVSTGLHSHLSATNTALRALTFELMEPTPARKRLLFITSGRTIGFCGYEKLGLYLTIEIARFWNVIIMGVSLFALIGRSSWKVN